MPNIAELLKMLLVGGASGGVGAGLGAVGARPQTDPRVAAMQAMQGRDPALQQRAKDNYNQVQGPVPGRAPGSMDENYPIDAHGPEELNSVYGQQSDKGAPNRQPMSTEEELAMTQKAMGGNDEDDATTAAQLLENDAHSEDNQGDNQTTDGNWEDHSEFILNNYKWQGTDKPTALDKKYRDDFPTDSVVKEYDARFGKR